MKPGRARAVESVRLFPERTVLRTILMILLVVALLPLLLIAGAIALGLFGTVLGIGIAILTLVAKLLFFVVLPVWLIWMIIRWAFVRA